MLSTTGGAEEESLNYSTKGRNRVLSSSSPSNSSSLASASPSSSSPSPFSPLALRPHPIPRTTTMEEVWNDISLASLHDRPSRDDSTTNTAFRGGLTFQDFLSRPLGKNPPPPASVAAGYGSPASPPVIGLSLNSVPDRFDLLGNSDDHPFRTNSLLRAHPIANVSSLNGSFDALPSSSSLLGLGKKRFTESDSHPGDRRHKRMIKNRESAARSRARKQAYTNELELEVAHLMEENARLKRQQQELCLAAAAQVPKKNILHRTSTAPF